MIERIEGGQVHGLASHHKHVVGVFGIRKCCTKFSRLKLKSNFKAEPKASWAGLCGIFLEAGIIM